jgi:hypothetical protein
VIDRKGMVRAVGLVPSRVEDVVKKLLAEPGPEETKPAPTQSTAAAPEKD